MRFYFAGANPDAWKARWQLISAAKTSVDLQYFIIEDDPYGFSLLGLLKEKITKDHVKVRLMVDARGTKKLSKKGLGQGYLQELVSLGAEVKVYNPTVGSPVNILKAGAMVAKAREAAKRFADSGLSLEESGELFEQLASGQCANHDKILIVDGESFMTGGRNIGRVYFADQSTLPTSYYDADVLIRSRDVAGKARAAFELEFQRPENFRVNRPLTNLHKSGALESAVAEMWASLGDTVPSAQADIAVERIELLDNTSNLHDPAAPKFAERDPAHVAITNGILALIASAQKRVWLVNPYVVLTPEVEAALAEAGTRGVDIRS